MVSAGCTALTNLVVASAAGKQGAHFPLLLNSSGVMVSTRGRVYRIE
jgi:hypothetical protein